MSGHPLLKASFCSTQKQRPSQTASDKAGQCSFSSHSGLGDYHLEFNPILFTLVVFHLFFHTDSVTFLAVVTKSPMRSSSRKEGFLLTRFQVTQSVTKAHCMLQGSQPVEAGQGDKCAFSFPFYALWHPHIRWCYPHSAWVFLSL